MRITSKGRVTIPVRIREQAGLLPGTEVEFAYEGGGQVRLFPVSKTSKRKTRGQGLVEHLRKQGQHSPIKMTTDELMALLRGED